MIPTLRLSSKLFFRPVAILLLCALCYAQATAETSDTSLPLDWTYEGDQIGSDLGISVSAAGDTDHDGFADVIVGAPLGNGSAYRTGAAYVFLGPISQNPIPDHTLGGPLQGSRFGTSVSSAGDVNNDGFGDIVVGAPGHKPGDLLPDAGGAYVYYGPLSGLNPVPDCSIEGEAKDIRLGTAVAGAGDIDGDGYDDIVLGAPLFSNGEISEGQIRVYYGSAGGILTGTSETQAIEGNAGGAMFGYSVAGAGDVNGDDYADVIVGAPSYDHNGASNGAAFLFLGSSAGLIAAPQWSAYSDQLDDNSVRPVAYGAVVGAAGDVNGDGYDDWFVSSPGYDGAHVDEGLVQVFYGRATAALATAVPDWSRTGGAVGARFGAGANTAGDVNKDGFADLLVGVPYYEDASPEGSGKDDPEVALVFLGSSSGLRPFRAWRLTCNQSSADFGTAVSGVGDTDKDGYGDLVVGAPQYKREEQVRGQAFGYLGVEGDGIIFSVYLPLVTKLP